MYSVYSRRTSACIASRTLWSVVLDARSLSSASHILDLQICTSEFASARRTRSTPRGVIAIFGDLHRRCRQPPRSRAVASTLSASTLSCSQRARTTHLLSLHHLRQTCSLPDREASHARVLDAFVLRDHQAEFGAHAPRLPTADAHLALAGQEVSVWQPDCDRTVDVRLDSDTCRPFS